MPMQFIRCLYCLFGVVAFFHSFSLLSWTNEESHCDLRLPCMLHITITIILYKCIKMQKKIWYSGDTEIVVSLWRDGMLFADTINVLLFYRNILLNIESICCWFWLWLWENVRLEFFDFAARFFTRYTGILMSLLFVFCLPNHLKLNVHNIKCSSSKRWDRS